MAPCCGSGCDYCATGIGSQVRYCFACAEVASRRVGLIEFSVGNGRLIQDWVNRAGTLRGLVVEISKHSKNVQSRTELVYVERPCEPWFLGLEVPDVALALYLTWHKAGMRVPKELEEHSQIKMQERRMLLATREPMGRKAW